MPFRGRLFPMPATIEDIDFEHPYPRAYAYQIYCAHPITGEALRTAFWRCLSVFTDYGEAISGWRFNRVCYELLKWYSHGLFEALTEKDMATAVGYDIDECGDDGENRSVEEMKDDFGENYPDVETTGGYIPVPIACIIPDNPSYVSLREFLQRILRAFRPHFTMESLHANYDQLSKSTYLYRSLQLDDAMIRGTRIFPIPSDWQQPYDVGAFCIYDCANRLNLLDAAIYFGDISLVQELMARSGRFCRRRTRAICIATHNFPVLQMLLLETCLREYHHSTLECMGIHEAHTYSFTLAGDIILDKLADEARAAQLPLTPFPKDTRVPPHERVYHPYYKEEYPDTESEDDFPSSDDSETHEEY
jgi:hypothetical protein